MLCCSAYRDLDESDEDFMGSKLVVSFANPAKHYDTHAIRPQNMGLNSTVAGSANSKLGLRGSGTLGGGGLLLGRPGMNGSKPGFNGRTSPSQPFAGARGQHCLACPSSVVCVRLVT